MIKKAMESAATRRLVLRPGGMRDHAAARGGREEHVQGGWRPDKYAGGNSEGAAQGARLGAVVASGMREWRGPIRRHCGPPRTLGCSHFLSA